MDSLAYDAPARDGSQLWIRVSRLVLYNSIHLSRFSDTYIPFAAVLSAARSDTYIPLYHLTSVTVVTVVTVVVRPALHFFDAPQ